VSEAEVGRPVVRIISRKRFLNFVFLDEVLFAPGLCYSIFDAPIESHVQHW
jgi:hypothetical protein